MIGLYEAMRDKAAVTLSLSVPLTALLPRYSTTRHTRTTPGSDSVQYSARLKYGGRSNRLSEVTNYTITPPRLSSLKCIHSPSHHKSEELFLTAGRFSLTNRWSIHLIMLWECISVDGPSFPIPLPMFHNCSWSCGAWRMPAGHPPSRLSKVYPIRNRSPSGPSGDREGIDRYFQLQRHRGGIYLMVPQPKPQATNKEDAIMPFDWAASFWLEMKCPVLSYRGWTSFVQPESGNIFPACLSGCSSLPWMMPPKPQPLRSEDFKRACNGLACLEEII